MKKTKSARKNYTTAHSSKELAEALGLDSEVDRVLMEHKALLSSMAAKAIDSSGFTINEIVKRSGVARSKVSAIKNGALAGISSDLFLKVITAAGRRVSFKIAS